MKLGKNIVVAGVAAVMALNVSSAALAKSSDISVKLNSRSVEFDVPPMIINDRTMVPMRKIFEEFNYSVEWNGDSKTITASGTNSVYMIIGNNTMQVDGKKITMDTPPQIIDGRTLIPLRALAESIGCEVDWEGSSRTVKIKSTAAQGSNNSSLIGEEKAKGIALRHAGLSENNISDFRIKLDYENGIQVYEIHFRSGEYEYEYDVDVNSGNILKSEKEFDDDYKNVTPQPKPQDSLMSEDKAKETALKHARVSNGNLRYFNIKLDTEDGNKVYDIDFVSGEYEYDYEVNAITGEILKSEKDYDDDYVKSSSVNSSVNETKAKEIALKHAGLTTEKVTGLKAEIDNDDGRSVYEVEFRYGGYEYNYDIDAKTGSIIEYDKDIDD